MEICHPFAALLYGKIGVVLIRSYQLNRLLYKIYGGYISWDGVINSPFVWDLLFLLKERGILKLIFPPHEKEKEKGKVK